MPYISGSIHILHYFVQEFKPTVNAILILNPGKFLLSANVKYCLHENVILVMHEHAMNI